MISGIRINEFKFVINPSQYNSMLYGPKYYAATATAKSARPITPRSNYSTTPTAKSARMTTDRSFN